MSMSTSATSSQKTGASLYYPQGLPVPSQQPLKLSSEQIVMCKDLINKSLKDPSVVNVESTLATMVKRASDIEASFAVKKKPVEDAISQLRNSLKTLQAAKDTAVQKQSDKRSEIAAQDTKIEELYAKIAEMQTSKALPIYQTKDFQSKRAAVVNELAQANAKKDQLEIEAQTLGNAVGDCTIKLDQANRNIDNLQQELTKLEADKALQLQPIAKAKSDFEKQNEGLIRKIEGCKAVLGYFDNQNSSAMLQAEQAAACTAIFQEAIRGNQQKAADIENEFQNWLTTARKTIESGNYQLLNQPKTVTDSLSQKKSTIEKLNGALAGHKANLATMNAELTSKNKKHTETITAWTNDLDNEKLSSAFKTESEEIFPLIEKQRAKIKVIDSLETGIPNNIKTYNKEIDTYFKPIVSEKSKIKDQQVSLISTVVGAYNLAIQIFKTLADNSKPKPLSAAAAALAASNQNGTLVPPSSQQATHAPTQSAPAEASASAVTLRWLTNDDLGAPSKKQAPKQKNIRPLVAAAAAAAAAVETVMVDKEALNKITAANPKYFPASHFKKGKPLSAAAVASTEAATKALKNKTSKTQNPTESAVKGKVKELSAKNPRKRSGPALVKGSSSDQAAAPAAAVKSETTKSSATTQSASGSGSGSGSGAAAAAESSVKHQKRLRNNNGKAVDTTESDDDVNIVKTKWKVQEAFLPADKTKFTNDSFHKFLDELTQANFNMTAIDAYLAKIQPSQLPTVLNQLLGDRAPIHMMAEKGNPVLLLAFINKYQGALDFKVATADGRKVMDFVVRNPAMNANGIDGVIKYFKEKQFTDYSKSDYSLLPIASYCGFIEIVKSLVKDGLMKAELAVDGLTAIHCSVLKDSKGNVEVLQWYLLNVIQTDLNLGKYMDVTSANNLYTLVPDTGFISDQVEKLPAIKGKIKATGKYMLDLSEID